MPVIVTGDDELEAKLSAFAEKGELERAYDDTGGLVKRLASGLVPVKTGTLKESIRQSRGKVNTTKTMVQAGNRGFPYAPIIHYGQYQNRTAQPFLTNALAIVNARYVEVRFNAEMAEQMKVSGL